LLVVFVDALHSFLIVLCAEFLLVKAICWEPEMVESLRLLLSNQALLVIELMRWW
jgi:hypothetical protein